MDDDTSGRREALAALAVFSMAGLAGCATRASASLPARAVDARYLLLGELHDNPALHELRLGWLRELTSERRRAIAMEQFDTSAQARIDAVRSAPGRSEAARRLAEAAGFSFDGWDWTLYEPVVTLVLQRQLPLIAANLSNAQTAAIARGQTSAVDASSPVGWTAADAAEMNAAIQDGHCGLLPDAMVPALARAQLARDRTMARALVDASRNTGLPVVLLAGNGHVRADIGVPRHLAELDPGASVIAIGFGENAAPPAGRFDRVCSVAPVARQDPCKGLRERFERRAG